MTGIVAKWDDARGWGFLRCDDGSGDCFVYHEQIMQDVPGRRSLAIGEAVEFDVIQTGRGRRAVDVFRVAATPQIPGKDFRSAFSEE
jgi:cold shock CspA family protein